MKKTILVSLMSLGFLIAGPILYTQAAYGVTITSPSSGKVYKAGDTLTVKWSAGLFSAEADTDIYLYPLKSSQWDNSAPALYFDSDANGNLNGASGDISGFDLKNSDGQFSWKIPAYMATQTKNYAINIRMFDYSGEPVYSQEGWSSNYITITGSETRPSIQMMSPSKGPAGTWVTLTGANFFPTNKVTYNIQSGMTYEITGVQSSDTKTVSFRLPDSLVNGIYDIAIITENGASGSMPFTVQNESTLQHAVGTNVKLPDGTVYRISENSWLQPYTSAGAFLSYKFNTWAGVVDANTADLALTKSVTYIPPRNGSLINDKGTVYLITGGVRAGFANEAAFKGMGYAYTNVYPGDTSFMTSIVPINSANQKHPNGTLINDNGTLYVMQNGYRVGFPSMAVLDSWGYWVTEAVPANSYDRQAEVSGVMQTRMANQMSI